MRGSCSSRSSGKTMPKPGALIHRIAWKRPHEKASSASNHLIPYKATHPSIHTKNASPVARTASLSPCSSFDRGKEIPGRLCTKTQIMPPDVAAVLRSFSSRCWPMRGLSVQSRVQLEIRCSRKLGATTPQSGSDRWLNHDLAHLTSQPTLPEDHRRQRGYRNYRLDAPHYASPLPGNPRRIATIAQNSARPGESM